MADIEPPSFSLGLDFDFEPSQAQQPSNFQTPKNSEIIEKGKGKEKEEEEEEEFDLRVSDSESDSPEKSTLTRLRRLRRGGPSSSKPISTPISDSVDDDDIEDFSDEDYVIKNDHLASHHHSSCSSSKLPLSGCGILMRKPESSTHDKRGKQDSSCPSTSLASSKGKAAVSNLAASPVRRFQLLDSESDHDDPSDGVQFFRKASGVGRLKNNKEKESDIQARFKLLDSDSDCDDPSDVAQINRKASVVDCLKTNEQESEIQARFKLLDSESEPDDPLDDAQIDRKASSADYLRKSKTKESGIYERFKLLDSESDTDDPSDGLRTNREASSVDISGNNKQKEANCRNYKTNLGRSSNSLPPESQNQDLWKDFLVNEKCSVPTPVFDELCEEYFKPVKSSKPEKFFSSEQEININNGKTIFQTQDSVSVVPPSHRYFLHDDSRIQRLVRCRLPHFSPLSTCNSHNASSSINYMSQFGQDGAKQRTGRQATVENNTKKGRKKTKKTNIEDTSLGSGNWVDPKQTARTPTDAGRRRVHADGQSSGQWFTADNGKKVYVAKNGKELTGKLAYIQYRKESGKGFMNKKKGAAKKK